jgi:hypoxanthine phosphoribosyltransferase
MIPVDIAWAEIDVYCREFCDSRIRSNTKYDTIIGIGRGGLVPAVIISHHLGVPLYPIMWQKRDGNKTSETFIKEYVKETPSNQTILIVDDINDSGVTLNEVRQSLEKWLHIYSKSATIHTMVVYEKESSNHKTDFSMEIVDDDEWMVFPWEAE